MILQIIPSNFLPMLLCYSSIFIFATAFFISAQCGGSKKKSKPKAGNKNKKAKAKGGKAAAGKKTGSKGGKKKAAPAAAGKGKKAADPKFGAIKSELSYEDANDQLRRTRDAPPKAASPQRSPTHSQKVPPRAPPPPSERKAAAPEAVEIQQPPKAVDKRPEQEGMADNAQGDYDTLNFIKRQDVFGKPKGGDSGGEDNNAVADGAGAAADDDQQQPEEDEEQQPQPEDEDKHDDKEEKQREQAGLQAGMAVGDYETLAELDQDDIFRKK